jgi:F0F1-type ATP synthase membrane subunit c/vacuolar-type H+-ATPase subunit K
MPAMVALPQGHMTTPADVLAYAADLAVELSVLCAAQGFDELGARFLEAAAEARRARAGLAAAPTALQPNAAPPDAT